MTNAVEVCFINLKLKLKLKKFIKLAKERNFYSNEYYRAVNNLEKKKFCNNLIELDFIKYIFLDETSQRDVKKLTVDVKDKFTSIFQKVYFLITNSIIWKRK